MSTFERYKIWETLILDSVYLCFINQDCSTGNQVRPGCYESHIHWWCMSRVLWKSYSLMARVQGVMKVIFTDGACPGCYESHIHWWLHVQGVMKVIFTDSECPGCNESHIHWWCMSSVLWKSYSLMDACPGCYKSHIHWWCMSRVLWKSYHLWWMSRMLWKSYSLMVHVQGVMQVIFTDGACPGCYASHIYW